ncbi:hypothetical protein RU89_GL001335 [Lactococcus cremoris]|nr:hypothetical protein llh_7945 [Lactococcus cremoris subsp. cremoris A76]KZK08703.1 hypothetical protein AB995_2072 [Lactococcus cremoris]KZK37149.1 hypothetical protein LMG6897_1875 [Lactococcus cremoris]KZK39571.1 hypothetical protein B40_2569 [Lactococcus cremoris]KZK45944.1 hypothetical protein FG2_1590 [Lactococcus cremoris]
MLFTNWLDFLPDHHFYYYTKFWPFFLLFFTNRAVSKLMNYKIFILLTE